ncbi:hypothetical protein CGK14_24140 [Vibrio parahaemolyticus]|uniref:hypothetical protein n=1 Tax=Vibrio TaxID=662 RepID=UPI0004719B4A|nr:MULTISPECIES: hypothetical protein [Vibrio]MCS0321297.1 hypothetical protein [Vibrio diabolicus]MDW3050397.1 hypothetical protein [Vibrio sp. 1408]TOA99998.1 hypothetical protein CGK14_24140 [Vibrio parahaemolyticus]TOB78244.1 hypothetical protein CGJ98_08450 [Vibrio parahaemolyticus]HCH6406702.1 hypothetical protein [Vibrio parahaemolyticus]
MSRAVLIFEEDSDFFKLLDTNIKRGNIVTIRFENHKPEHNSKLWKRLRNTKSWDLVEAELEKVENNQPTPIASIISSNMKLMLTGGELMLIAWIATLLTALFAYAIYKGRKVRFKVSGDGQGGSGEIIIE